jgi:hypothetical protein
VRHLLSRFGMLMRDSLLTRVPGSRSRRCASFSASNALRASASLSSCGV